MNDKYGTIKARGFVLKEYNNAEANKNIVILFKGIGKKYIYVKNGKNIKSKLHSGAKIFTYSDYVLYEGRGFFTMNDVDVIKSFYHLSSDFDKFCCLTVITELTEKVILEGENCDEILLLLIKTFQTMEKNHLRPRTILAVYILKFLQYNGYAPEITQCTICADLYDNSDIPLYFNGEGWVCKNCSEKIIDVIMINQGTINALNYIISNDPSKLYNFTANDIVSEQLDTIAFKFLHHHINIHLKSLEILNSL